MRNDYVGHRSPSTLWLMAGAEAAVGGPIRRGDHVATPLPVAVTAAGLVSAVRFGSDAVERRGPQVAQWEAIRSHYQEVADWIDNDAAGGSLATAATDFNAAGRMSRAGLVDYLGLLNCSVDDAVRRDDVLWWLSGRPDYWVTAGASVDAASTELAEFRRDYVLAAIIGPLHVYRRCTAGDTV
jgi:uncharacterized membrane protein YhiD involved in acid resistance